MAGAAPTDKTPPGGTSRTMPLAAVLLILGGLAAHEGTKQTPYRDKLAPGQPWTVCAGITGKGVIPGKKYSLLECKQLEQAYVQRMAARMEPCLKEPLSVYEWVAWGDFSYNLGTGKWCGSTALQLLNQGKHREACDQILRWKYTNGLDCTVKANKCDGIITRRKWQHATCLRGI